MKNSANTSEDLLNRYLANSSRASFELHARYQNRLISFARRQLMEVLKAKVDPADIAQETFQAFFDLANKGDIRWKKTGDLWRLLAGIAVNKVKRKFEHYSAIKRDIRSEAGQQTVSFEPYDVEASALALAELVDHILSTEKPLVRSVLELRLAGYSNTEIAEKVGRSARTVRRVMESLQAKLIADNDLEFGLLQEPKMDKVVSRSTGTTNVVGGEHQQPKQIAYRDFQLLRMIGQGSFAKVYLAKRISDGKLFAIKAIRKRWLADLDARAAFLNEAKLLKQLDDPNVVRTFGIGKLPNGGCFLLLEFIEGTPILQAAIHASPDLIRLWLADLDSTIQRIHKAGIIHGDIRSPNILVDTEGKIRIVDFGLGGFNQANSKSSVDLDLKAIGLIKVEMRGYRETNDQ